MDWKLIKQIDVGSWKTGWIVTDNDRNVRLLVTVDKDRFCSSNGPNFCEEARMLFNCKNKQSEARVIDAIYERETSAFTARMKKLVGVTHANLTHAYDFQFDEKNFPTAIMEYYIGEPIITALKRAPLPLFLAHFKQVFEALSFIHRQGMLVLHWKSKFILTDVVSGITKIVNVWSLHTKEEIDLRQIDFNPQYAAPETILGEPVSVKSDLYSVAMMMLESWGNDKYFNFTNSLQKKDVTEMRSDSKVATPELGENFILNLLKKNPKDRGFESAKEVVNYIMETWPEVCKPAKDLYGKIKTTVRL